MKLKLLVASLFLLTLSAHSQSAKGNIPKQPKLIVGIVVDQMSYDFLYRYWENYSEGGFKKLVTKGFSCENTQYNYVPTYTGPGHASIYTGSVPAIHGIVSNDWYNKYAGTSVYCASDTTAAGVGTTSIAGKMSPRNLLVTTICDELKLFNNMHSKVIGIALKDRGAILPAGHLANAAYWYDGYANAWVTSTYYMQTLPQWVTDFNSKNYAAAYITQDWNLLLPAAKYSNSTVDNVSWERLNTDNSTSSFPHKIINPTSTESVKATPFGNTFTADFAKTTILNEGMGKDDITDFLCVSFSSTDYVGHNYGPYSQETEDTYIRFDRDLAALIDFLDKQVGAKNYLLFLTADHGVAPAAGFAKSIELNAGIIYETNIQAKMEAELDSLIQPGNWIKAFANQNIYLNDSMLQVANTSADKIFSVLQPEVLKMDGVANAFLIADLNTSTIPEVYKQKFINGMYPKRSGDIFIEYEPNWMEWYNETGSTHGSHYAYDTHVPLLWYGWGIKKGNSNRNVDITDIAATLAALLHIKEPSGCIGSPIDEIEK